MAIDNLSLSPIRVATPAPGASQPAANNAPAPTIGSDKLTLSNPTSLLANANNVAAANTAKVAPATPAPTTADVATTGGSYAVKPGDTLSGIAQAQLGDVSRWPEIYDLNKDQIKDPNLIYPGQTFKLPGAKPAEVTTDDTTEDTTDDTTQPSLDDLEPVDDAPETASTEPAPAAAPTCKPIPRDFPPYGPTRCFPPHPSYTPDRSQLLRQKLELLQMEEQVVKLELQLDHMLAQFDRPQYRFKSASPITQ
jgi:LysM repeat protein